jgi:hypothetical protein
VSPYYSGQVNDQEDKVRQLGTILNYVLQTLAMKMIYALLGLILFVGLAFYLTSCNNKSQGQTELRQDTTARKKVDSNNNPYNELRNLAFSATEEQIGIQFPSEQTKIYGIVMDWDLGEGTATLVTFLSGDASLYLSSGGGVIGGGGHENVKQSVIAFIAKAEKYLDKTTKTEVTSLPELNGVKFYFLTNKGKFVGQETIQNFANNSSDWLDLFEEGNKVITEIRNTTPGDV